jgi:hypothetical protein
MPKERGQLAREGRAGGQAKFEELRASKASGPDGRAPNFTMSSLKAYPFLDTAWRSCSAALV